MTATPMIFHSLPDEEEEEADTEGEEEDCPEGDDCGGIEPRHDAGGVLRV